MKNDTERLNGLGKNLEKMDKKLNSIIAIVGVRRTGDTFLKFTLMILLAFAVGRCTAPKCDCAAEIMELKKEIQR